jgi:hypothetical protein
VIEVTELPIGVWTEDYKTFLEEQVGKDGCPKDIKSYCTDTAVRFIPQVWQRCRRRRRPAQHGNAYKLASSPKNLRLTTCTSSAGGECQAVRAGVDEMFTDHAAVRLRTYIARKAHQLAELELIVSKVSARARSHRRHRCRHAGPVGPRLSWAPLEESAYPRSGTMAFVHLLMPVSSLTSEAGEALETTPPRPRGRATPRHRARTWMKELDELRLRCALTMRSTSKIDIVSSSCS